MGDLSKKTRISLLAAAFAVLAIAAVWAVLLESKSYTRALCGRINEFGYSVTPSDLYSQGYGRDTSIAEVMGGKLTDEEILTAVKLSEEKCFDARIDEKGSVELMLWNMDDNRVMVVYLLNREPQLVFIENISTGEISPVGE